MRNSMFLSDFLLLKDVLCEELVDNCVSSYDKCRRVGSPKNMDEHHDDLLALCDWFLEDKRDEFIHFENEDHMFRTIEIFIRMMWDAYNTKTKYVITTLHKIPENVKL